MRRTYGPSQIYSPDPTVDLLTPEFISFGVTRVKVPFHWKDHGHEDIEMIHVTKGTYGCRVNGTALSLVPDQVLMVGPGDRHEDNLIPPCAYYSIRVRLLRRPSGAVKMFRQDLPAKDRILSVPPKMFDPVLKELEAEVTSGDPLGLQVVKERCLAYFWQVLRLCPQEILSPQVLLPTEGQVFADRLSKVFQMSLESDLTVEAMASAFGMSPSHFAHTCTRVLKMSPMKAFTRYRMEQARALLAGTSLGMKEVAAMVGFRDASHFSHVFSRTMGVSPRKFRVKTRV